MPHRLTHHHCTNPSLAGHSEQMTKDNICTQIDAAFNTATYSGQCRGDVATTVRQSRGLTLQHDKVFVADVLALQSKLSEQGYYTREYDSPTLFQRPHRANFLHRVLGGETGGAPVTTYCESGFGAGHSALLALRSAPTVRVFTFDHGLARHTVPAHDVLDGTYPDRLFMFLGDSAVTIASLRAYYPGTQCDVIYVDGSYTYNGASVVCAARGA